MSQAPASLQPPSFRTAIRGLLPSILVNGVLVYLIYTLLKNYTSASDLVALLIFTCPAQRDCGPHPPSSTRCAWYHRPGIYCHHRWSQLHWRGSKALAHSRVLSHRRLRSGLHCLTALSKADLVLHHSVFCHR